MDYLPTNHHVHAFTASTVKRVIVSGQKPAYGGRKKAVGKGLFFRELTFNSHNTHFKSIGQTQSPLTLKLSSY